ncbi:hypothetical protein [Falsibacillus pallidus]
MKKLLFSAFALLVIGAFAANTIHETAAAGDDYPPYKSFEYNG